MVSSFVCSGVRIHVLQLLQRLVKMTPNNVRGVNRIALSRAKEKSTLSLPNELLEHLSDARMKINLTKAIRGFQPLFDFPMMNFLLDVEGEETGRDVLISMPSASRSSDPLHRTR